METLRPKERRFCEELLIDENATAAYLRAGYKAKNANVAGASAHMMLKKPKIQDYLRQRRAELLEKVELTQEMVIRELMRCGFANIEDYVEFGVNGVTLKKSVDLTRAQLAAVAEVSQTAEGTIKFKMHDKKGSLELLARKLGMLVEKVEHSGTIKFESVDVSKLPTNILDRLARGDNPAVVLADTRN